MRSNFNTDKRTFLKILMIGIFIVVGAYSLYDKNTARVGETITSTSGDLIGKTYEQGLWDGFNRAFVYLDHTGQIKDTLKIEITIADSILHAK